MKAVKTLIALATLSIFATGCSTVSGGGTTQSMSFKAVAADGKEVEGVKCDLKNDAGAWYVVTPASVVVHRSNKDLQVNCKAPNEEIANANVTSRTTGNMYGNILLGGVIGAVIDHSNGSAYEYPAMIKIVMGTLNQKFEAISNAVSAKDETATPSTVSK